MTGEDGLLSLLEGFKPLPCEGCNDPDLSKRPMIEPVLGEILMHDGSHFPAAVYSHGLADDNRPHWEKKIPIRAKK